MPIITTKDVLGHADVRSTEVYVQTDLEAKRKALEQAGTPSEDTRRSRKLAPDLLQWLDGFDPDALIAEPDRYAMRHAHEHVWEEAGWRIEFTPIPKSPERRGKPGRAIGMSGEARSAIKVLR